MRIVALLFCLMPVSALAQGMKMDHDMPGMDMSGMGADHAMAMHGLLSAAMA